MGVNCKQERACPAEACGEGGAHTIERCVHASKWGLWSRPSLRLRTGEPIVHRALVFDGAVSAHPARADTDLERDSFCAFRRAHDWGPRPGRRLARARASGGPVRRDACRSCSRRSATSSLVRRWPISCSCWCGVSTIDGCRWASGSSSNVQGRQPMACASSDSSAVQELNPCTRPRTRRETRRPGATRRCAARSIACSGF